MHLNCYTLGQECILPACQVSERGDTAIQQPATNALSVQVLMAAEEW